MKFGSLFTVGDKVWVDRSSGYCDLVQNPRWNIHGVNELNRQLDLHDGNFLIGISLIYTPITESNFSVELKNGKTIYWVGHLLGEIGCSAWGNETFRKGSYHNRIVSSSKEEARYYANKAYLIRLNKIIKGFVKKASDVDNLSSSELSGLQSDILKMNDLKNSILEELKDKPKLYRKKVIRRESKWNIGDSFWTTGTSDYVFATWMDFNGRTGNCADRISPNDFETLTTIYKILSDNPKKIIINNIRTWDCEGLDYLYQSKAESHEYHEKFCFATESEAAKFFKEFVFVNRRKYPRKDIINKYLRIIKEVLTTDMSPKNRRQLETFLDKFNNLTREI